MSKIFDISQPFPSAIEVEEAVLGALLINPSAIYDIADDFTPECFYDESNQIIAQTIANLFDQSKKIDLLTTQEYLKSKKQLEKIGGPIYLMKLMSKISSSAHIKDHYRIIFQKYIQRESIKFAGELNACSFDEGVDLEEIIDKLNRGVDQINEKIVGKKQASHISQILNKSELALKKREEAAKQNKISGIRTPTVGLDKKLQGWKPNVIVIAATSGEGKTAVMLAAAKKAAEEGKWVNIYSLEMEDVTLGDRLILAEADISAERYASGYMSKEDWTQFYKAKEKLSKLPIICDDNPVVGFTYIKTHSRINKKKGMCDLIMIDYIQLGLMEKEASREREIAKFMRNLVILKKDLGVPIIALSQLNKVYEDKRKRPTLANLRESGAIGQDADIVIFIYRMWHHGIKEDSDGNSTEGMGIFIVAKHRNGPTGDVKFKHNPSLTKISDWVDPNQFGNQPISNRDRQLPPEKDDVEPEIQGDLPF